MSVVVNEFEVVPEPAPAPEPQRTREERDPAESQRLLAELLRKRAARVERLRAT